LQRTTIIGIDCAVSDFNTGIAVGVVRDGALNLQSVSLGMEPWAETVTGIVAEHSEDRFLLCLDSPLGWPRSLKIGLSGHRAGERVPGDYNQWSVDEAPDISDRWRGIKGVYLRLP
jgi:hypothetical protein